MIEGVVLRDVLAAVGDVMLRWGFLEAELLGKMREAGLPLHPTAAPIQQWRQARDSLPAAMVALSDQIEGAAGVRNLLAHGLCGARSYPDPGVRCRRPTGEVATITYKELSNAAEDIDRLRLAIRRGGDGQRATCLH